jgi:single-strand DNA-binding protein
VATSETWTDKATSERKERTEWHRVVIFNDRLADVAERYLKKGAKVYLEGTLETRKYTDQSGAEKYSTEVVLRPFRGELTMLGGRGDGDAETGGVQGGDDHNSRPPPLARWPAQHERSRRCRCLTRGRAILGSSQGRRPGR